MATVTTYSIRYDNRSKELLLLALSNLQQQLEAQITQGDTQEGLQNMYNQVGQVKNGILFAPPEEVELDTTEPEDVESSVESSEEMYKSQEFRQS